jgi:hypothetical protein
VNFPGCLSQKLRHQPVAALEFELFGDHAKSAVGGDEVHCLDASVAVDELQEMLEEE